jgi:hypothetical protein
MRAALLAVGALLVLAGLALWAVGVRPGALQLVGLGGTLVIALLIERWRYHRPATAAGRHFTPTGERFEDPGSGRVVEVLYDPHTGERRYVPAAEPGSERAHTPDT